jgi:hypothetical protein
MPLELLVPGDTQGLLKGDDDDGLIVPPQVALRGIKWPLLVRLALFMCGMGVFARAEAFLLQTQVSQCACIDLACIHYHV